MMKRLSLLLFAAIFLLSLSGCVSKRLTKKAIALDQAGMYNEASTLYLQALQSNPNNTDAKIGLSRSGNLVMIQKLDNFKKQYDNKNSHDAVYAYLDCLDFSNSAASYGVQLPIAAEYTRYYQEVETQYLAGLYTAGMKYMGVEDFSNGAQVFSEITSINANYKDSNTQLKKAIYEPKYRAAVSQLANKLPRTAFFGFDAIEKGTGGYKESNTLRQKALNQATITISVIPFRLDQRERYGFEEVLQSKTEDNITAIPIPFYKVVLQDEPIVDRPRIINNGKNVVPQDNGQIQPDAVLSGIITDFKPTRKESYETRKCAYLASTITVYDSLRRTRVPRTIYDKIEYIEVTKKAKSSATLRYSLINTKDNRILISDAIQEEESSIITYNVFDGDPHGLIPGYWEKKSAHSPQDRMATNQTEIDNFRVSFIANPKLPTAKELELNLANRIGMRIADKIASYNPEP